MILQLLIPLLISAFVDAAPKRVQRMTVSKMQMADLESSATGYVYEQQQGLPVSYVQYTNHGSGRYYHAPDTVRYVVDGDAPVAQVPTTAPRYEPTVLVFATKGSLPDAEERSYANEEIANYANEPLSEYVPVLGSIKSEPRAPYYVESTVEKEKIEEEPRVNDSDDENDEKDEEEGDDDDDEDEEHGEDDEEDDDDENDHFEYSGKKLKSESGYGDEKFGDAVNGLKGYGGHDGDESSFEAGGGEKHGAEEYAEHGEKGDKGYKSRKEFSEGEKGEHDKEDRKGFYDVAGGHKKGHVDAAGEYGSSDESEKKEEGENYGHKSYHKKGEKTNGFHNVYQKDEYKKNTDFYDDEHKEGHFDKHEELSKHHKAGEGGFEKGRHHSSGFDHENRGKDGYYDKGHHQSKDRGHEAEEDEKSYYGNHADFARKDGSNSAKAYEFSKGSE